MKASSCWMWTLWYHIAEEEWKPDMLFRSPPDSSLVNVFHGGTPGFAFVFGIPAVVLQVSTRRC